MEIAFQKLAYIRNPSTIKFVAQFLYSDEHFPTGSHEPPWWANGAAIRALRQMVDNPPDAGGNWTGEKWDEWLKVWQRWWQQNKGKYP